MATRPLVSNKLDIKFGVHGDNRATPRTQYVASGKGSPSSTRSAKFSTIHPSCMHTTFGARLGCSWPQPGESLYTPCRGMGSVGTANRMPQEFKAFKQVVHTC